MLPTPFTHVLATSQCRRESDGASLEHSREEMSDLFCQEFGTGSLKTEDFPTSQSIRKMHFQFFSPCLCYCSASISAAMRRTPPHPSVPLSPLLRVQSYLGGVTLLFRGWPAQCCKFYLSSQEMSFQMRREPWTSWDYPRLEAGHFWWWPLV